jgi:hypothetical protein
METRRVLNYKNREMCKLFWAMGMMILLASCGKDVDVFIPRTNQGDGGDISRLMTRLNEDFSSQTEYVVTVPCSGDVVFEVDKDVVVVIPKNFVDLTSFPCTDGFVDVHISVCDSKGEILVAGIPTISEGQLLESRVEINLQLKRGSEHAKLSHDRQIGIKVKDPDPRDRMELFYGNDTNTAWLQADGDPSAWDNVSNNEWLFIDDSTQTVISGFGYECFSDSTDWINVDVFFDVPEEHRTPVCVVLPEIYTNKNTAVFMVFDDYKSILHMPGDADAKQFCEPYGATPVGYNVTFVVISEMGEDRYLFATKSTTVTHGHIEYMTPVQTPYNEIRNYLQDL